MSTGNSEALRTSHAKGTQAETTKHDGITAPRTLARVLAELGLGNRPQQDRLYAKLGADRGITQAGTGTGKSLAVLAAAADVGAPGSPAVILTATNALARQYIAKDAPAVARATGMTFTRLMGGSHYVCASSAAAVDAGIPGYDDGESREEIKAQREAWLAAQTGDDFATEFELQPWQDERYACPGHPDCEGSAVGGCGKRHARARGFHVDVIITNFHVAAFNQLFPDAGILPRAAKVFVDEAHAMPDRLASVLDCRIGPRWGAKSDVSDELRALVDGARRTALAGLRWDDKGFHVEQEVRLDDATMRRLEAAIKAADDDEGDDERLGAITTVEKWIQASRGEGKFVAIARRNERHHVHLQCWDATNLARAVLGERWALVSGTVQSSLPARVGHPEVTPADVGHPFDYGRQVRGSISRHSGVKSRRANETEQDFERRITERLKEVARFVSAPGARSLILATSHADVTLLNQRLTTALRPAGITVFTQPSEGGSVAARAVAEQFLAHKGQAVLIGTESYGTGLDVPGDALNRLVMWSLPLGLETVADRRRARRFPSYRDDRTRVTTAQGVGRLIRRTDDEGALLLSDERFRGHLNLSNSMVDAHLRQIPWSVA